MDGAGTAALAHHWPAAGAARLRSAHHLRPIAQDNRQVRRAGVCGAR